MKIIIRQFYWEPGHSYPFSFRFTDWLVKELTKRVRASKSFIETYAKDFAVGITLDASSKISEPEVTGPKVFRRDKEVIVYIVLPHLGGPFPTKPKGYAWPVKLLFDSIATGLQRLGLDASRFVEDAPALIRDFISSPDMIYDDDWDKTDVEPKSKKAKPLMPSRKSSQPSTAKATPSTTVTEKRLRAKRVSLPKWKVPKNVAKRVEADDGLWESERFDPILLTVMSDTSYQGRDIPLAWQIEFDPGDDRLAAANEKMETSGIEPDGDGWSSVIEKQFAWHHPKLAREFHSDSECSTCVVWVESETACQKLIEVVWALMYPALTTSA